ncbi:hypothetical protein MADA3029_1230153 [Vibrio nigripulchritudo MADA3029]|uniref:Uncharacterized protein n=2 Tax=Vibrio nigripulchritudo TaxID=28173 RepID=U4K7B3_9VIBR|nr:hypothetical protein VIBNIAM115_1920044 [Vibrio nigripulchritudo AM115]CCN43688.1 hypothetical protein VIBNIFTn2_60045 [Vibrio nigripulchritudo FTn2]CCN48347.1 hypothetical protein VIBNIMADA3020_580205 [Vibrio nigripulchritudo MADA3020]CCN52116.1 hypothetical protein VIBNIMADA3021_1210047 [Vibrio nigripulchritudo MADA3021]CCN58156.1 hypothetical protein MADA3029_1230153 [Vibrio nigripulchritudo MADA3029]CCN65991.1 hypothetical protein VIBNIPon4_480030 [Vibrio nigripulchritudo POn4]CCN73065
MPRYITVSEWTASQVAEGNKISSQL